MLNCKRSRVRHFASSEWVNLQAHLDFTWTECGHILLQLPWQRFYRDAGNVKDFKNLFLRFTANSRRFPNGVTHILCLSQVVLGS